MLRIVVSGRRGVWHTACPECGGPIRFDYATDALPNGKVRTRPQMIATGMRLHLIYGCPARSR